MPRGALAIGYFMLCGYAIAKSGADKKAVEYLEVKFRRTIAIAADQWSDTTTHRKVLPGKAA